MTVTNTAKKPLIITPGLHDQIDVVETYSATYEWLVQVRDCARVSGGFEVV